MERVRGDRENDKDYVEEGFQFPMAKLNRWWREQGRLGVGCFIIIIWDGAELKVAWFCSWGEGETYDTLVGYGV